MVSIYILLLEGNNYYIGKSENVDSRLESHFNNNGSEWTKLHKPIKRLQLITNCSDFDEDKYTLEYMNKYGIDKVRGGTYSQVKLSDEKIKFIKERLDSANNKCFRCGGNHFIKDCDKKYCERCKRNNHNKNDCYAKTDKDGKEISDNSVDDKVSFMLNKVLKEEKKIVKEEKKEEKVVRCQRCNRFGHDKDHCYAKTDTKGIELCLRCNRKGHSEDNCYAKSVLI